MRIIDYIASHNDWWISQASSFKQQLDLEQYLELYKWNVSMTEQWLEDSQRMQTSYYVRHPNKKFRDRLIKQNEELRQTNWVELSRSVRIVEEILNLLSTRRPEYVGQYEEWVLKYSGPEYTVRPKLMLVN